MATCQKLCKQMMFVNLSSKKSAQKSHVLSWNLKRQELNPLLGPALKSCQFPHLKLKEKSSVNSGPSGPRRCLPISEWAHFWFLNRVIRIECRDATYFVVNFCWNTVLGGAHAGNFWQIKRLQCAWAKNVLQQHRWHKQRLQNTVIDAKAFLFLEIGDLSKQQLHKYFLRGNERHLRSFMKRGLLSKTME